MPILSTRALGHGARRATSQASFFGKHSATLGAALRVLRKWLERSGQRRALRELAQEGRRLEDIGICRKEALREAAKPFWRR
jgi:uncharacterized protein YjiS (DUF1127 family)